MPDDAVRVEVSGFRDELAEVIERIMDEVERCDYPKAARFAIRLALEEAVSNAVKHGNRGDEEQPLVIEYAVCPERVAIDIEDSGPGFDPADVPDPTLDENLERPSGRGIMLMRAYMTSVAYNETGNRVAMRYDRAAACREPEA